MKMTHCPDCGQPTDAEAAVCLNCGHALANGAAQAKSPAGKPAPPPEANEWIIEPTPPEMIERARQAFNMEEYLAGVREIEKTGGLQFEDFVEELKQAAGEHD